MTKANSRLEEIRQIRLAKVKTLHELGINPYPANSQKEHPNAEIVDNFDKYESKEVTLTGRLMSFREHGNIAFGHIQDESGQIQVFIQKKLLSETSKENQTLGFKDAMKLLDVGDFVQVKGEVGKTTRGEISVMPTEIRLLTKSIRPLPEKWHGVKDEETKYRQRYLDLIMSEESRNVFKARTKFVSLLRKYLDENGFMEVKTPALQPLYGGATAKPFITQYNALDAEFYLRIADELYLKRLIAGGFDKVYEIGTDFRNEGMDRWHNPEFQMLEFYWAYADYEDLMKMTEEMLSEIVKEITGDYKVRYGELEIDFSAPWKRLSYRDSIYEKTQIDIDKVMESKNPLEDLQKQILDNDLMKKSELVNDVPELIDQLYKKHVRPKLINPVFLTDHPESMRPLAKKKSSDPTKVESFQLVAASAELINAYSELNDPQDQRERWESDMERAGGDIDEYQVLDEDYLQTLEFSMPPTAGWGMGIDRFTAILTDQHAIKDVILFPSLKPKERKKTKKK